jgi:hypothetical protein
MNFIIAAPSPFHLGDPTGPIAKLVRSTQSVSTGQPSSTSRRELPNRERASRMITLTRDLDVFLSRVTTDLPAVFFPIRHIAQARNMCALSRILFRHFLLLSIPIHCIHISKPQLGVHEAFARLCSWMKVNDVVSVGRLIAASVFGRRESILFTDPG